MIGHHLSASARRNAASASGVCSLARGDHLVQARSAWPRTPSSASAATTAALSLSTTSLGVPFGTQNACQNEQMEARHAGFVGGRDLLRRRQPRRRHDGVGPDLAAARQRQRAAARRRDTSTSTCPPTRSWIAGAAPRYGTNGPFAAGDLLQVEAAQMRERAGADEALRHLLLVRLQPRDQLGQRLGRQIAAGDSTSSGLATSMRPARNPSSRRSSTDRRAVEHLRADVADADGVAVRRRACDAADADRAAGAARRSRSRTAGRAVPRMCSVITRATGSSGPPAGYGTISEIGRDG